MVSMVYAGSCFLPKACLWPGSSEHIVPALPEPRRAGWITPCAPPGEAGSPKTKSVALSSVTPSTSLPRGRELPSNSRLKSKGKHSGTAATSPSGILCFYSQSHLPPHGLWVLTWMLSMEVQSIVFTQPLSGHSALVVQMKIKYSLLMWGAREKTEMSSQQCLSTALKHWAKQSV